MRCDNISNAWWIVKTLLQKPGDNVITSIFALTQYQHLWIQASPWLGKYFSWIFRFCWSRKQQMFLWCTSSRSTHVRLLKSRFVFAKDWLENELHGSVQPWKFSSDVQTNAGSGWCASGSILKMMRIVWWGMTLVWGLGKNDADGIARFGDNPE